MYLLSVLTCTYDCLYITGFFLLTVQLAVLLCTHTLPIVAPFLSACELFNNVSTCTVYVL